MRLTQTIFTALGNGRSGVVLSVLAVLGLAGCKATQPEAVSLTTATPSIFKNGGQTGETPSEAWWKLFSDSKLNELENKIETENLDLRAGLARIDQAYALLGVSRADLVPSLDGTGSITRSRVSEGDQQFGLGGGGFGGGGGGFANPLTQYRAGMALGWEVDLWKRVRYLVEAAESDLVVIEETTDDLRLSLQSQLARNYFNLRYLDDERRVLREAVQSRRDNLKIATDRFEGGRTGELDVARAETELASTRADLASLAGTRNKLENAIAVLVGIPPSNFELAARSPNSRLPHVKAGLPATVLANRPDVASAIATLHAANARIGVAKAEFFPKINLVGTGGLSSIDSNDFLTWSNRYFTIGPEVTLPIFQGGRLKNSLANRRAVQAEALASYQQIVLLAFRDVEDALADLAALRDERSATLDAVSASNRALDLSRRRYDEGLVSSIEVIDAIREQLTAERRAVQVRSRQYDATVLLIQAIGGGLTSKYTK